jgi:hypothetical protein
MWENDKIKRPLGSEYIHWILRQMDVNGFG